MWVRQGGAAVSGHGDSKGRPGAPVTTGYDGLGGERSAPLTLCQGMLPSRKTLGGNRHGGPHASGSVALSVTSL
ncbi:hypothetical protein GCM10022207_67150 [Streptomyces lannensis]|uniref:Uncharacterized protein n=1 Tax=Streptomyces lannensis TaxID=766498 RepID=A0ABP7L033_9ACTN